MAKNRYISTSFWDDEWIQSLESHEKLLFIYLLTNPLTTLAGIYRITIRRMSFDTKIEENIVSQSIRKFEEAKKAFLIGDWLILPNVPKHQIITPKNHIRENIDSILRALPENVFQFLLSCNYTYIFMEELDRCQALHRISTEDPCKPLGSPLEGPSMPHVSPLEGPSMPHARASNYININSNLNINNNIKNKDGNSPPPTPQDPFKKPTIEEVRRYINDNGYSVNPGLFIDHYEANGWLRGKTRMKDWKAAIRYWDKCKYSSSQKTLTKQKMPKGILDMEEVL